VFLYRRFPPVNFRIRIRGRNRCRNRNRVFRLMSGFFDYDYDNRSVVTSLTKREAQSIQQYETFASLPNGNLAYEAFFR